MKKRKLNVVDWIIILLVVAALCVAGYFYVAGRPAEAVADTVKIDFTVMVTNLPQETAESFKIGDYVSFGESTSGSGVISNVEITPYTKLTENKKDGKFVWSGVPEKYTAYVTISSEVTKTEYDYTSGSEVVAVGKKMPFNSVGAASESSYVVNLTEAE